jgi:CRISPR/Cas system-associated exonuclease Cas4 (RecB family)
MLEHTNDRDTVREKEQMLDAEAIPHLSYSRIQRYLTCPEQCRFYYVEGLRAKVESASLVFGAVVHLALAELFRHGADPVATFTKEWEALREVELRYSRKESWQSLKQKGEKLLQKFTREEVRKIGKVISVEKVFKLALSNLDLPFIGIIDLIAEKEGKRTLVEFKTAVTDFEDYEVVLSDQLTAYQLAEPDVKRVAVCVFVKSKEPRIEWHITERKPEQIVEYLDKVELVAGQIERRNFYKRPRQVVPAVRVLAGMSRRQQESRASPRQNCVAIRGSQNRLPLFLRLSVVSKSSVPPEVGSLATTAEQYYGSHPRSPLFFSWR